MRWEGAQSSAGPISGPLGGPGRGYCLEPVTGAFPGLGVPHPRLPSSAGRGAQPLSLLTPPGCFSSIHPASKGLCRVFSWPFSVMPSGPPLPSSPRTPLGVIPALPGFLVLLPPSPRGCVPAGGSVPPIPCPAPREHTCTLGALCRRGASPWAPCHSLAVGWELLISWGLNAAHSSAGKGAACKMHLCCSSQPSCSWPRCVWGERVPVGSVSVTGSLLSPSLAGCCPHPCPLVAHRPWEPSCLAAPTPLPLPGLREETGGKCLKSCSEPLFPPPAGAPLGPPWCWCPVPTHGRCREPSPRPAVPPSWPLRPSHGGGGTKPPPCLSLGCSRSSAQPPRGDAAPGTALAARSCPLPRSRGSSALLMGFFLLAPVFQPLSPILFSTLLRMLFRCSQWCPRFASWGG